MPLQHMRLLLERKDYRLLKVWLCLVDDAAKNGVTCMPHREIRQKTGLCENSVRGALQVLEERGYIDWVSGEGTETKMYLV